jgi:hypothetical protein
VLQALVCDTAAGNCSPTDTAGSSRQAQHQHTVPAISIHCGRHFQAILQSRRQSPHMSVLLLQHNTARAAPESPTTRGVVSVLPSADCPAVTAQQESPLPPACCKQKKSTCHTTPASRCRCSNCTHKACINQAPHKHTSKCSSSNYCNTHTPGFHTISRAAVRPATQLAASSRPAAAAVHACNAAHPSCSYFYCYQPQLQDAAAQLCEQTATAILS